MFCWHSMLFDYRRCIYDFTGEHGLATARSSKWPGLCGDGSQMPATPGKAMYKVGGKWGKGEQGKEIEIGPGKGASLVVAATAELSGPFLSLIHLPRSTGTCASDIAFPRAWEQMYPYHKEIFGAQHVLVVFSRCCVGSLPTLRSCGGLKTKKGTVTFLSWLEFLYTCFYDFNLPLLPQTEHIHPACS